MDIIKQLMIYKNGTIKVENLILKNTEHFLEYEFEPVEITAIAKLIVRYKNIPMSLADACLVRMAEQYPDSIVMTLDSDFKVYRKNGRQVIPTIMPEQES